MIQQTTVMKLIIAIIGLGNSGTGLATRLVNSPYRLLLFDQDFSKAQALTDQLLSTTLSGDVEAVDCQVNASWEADIIVLAVSESSKKQLCDRIREVATCKIIISLSTSTNDVHTDYLNTYTNQEWQPWLPTSKVVNVLNTIGLSNAFLIGTNLEALTTVSEVMQAAGLHPIVVEDWSVYTTPRDSVQPIR
ncbi:NADP oxidoreductase [Spirosoma sp. HMF3257]|uniref:NADP oxidoreductase n=2 Tax=Spirosoma telluris TaxID=2183553 RepID=A0A327NII4_9BACT|nr:NADP oxidoreductase [Spirosoma telluris]RAI75181.1 NADP oxidoreductase [Spirosoma telluris]